MKKFLTLAAALLLLSPISAQKKNTVPAAPDTSGGYETRFLGQMKWRNIGPYRAGRSLAVSGVKGDRNVYYAGQVGGGVWKTIDGGTNWYPMADSAFHSSSVGGLAVAPSDPNIVYVGMGEPEMRNNISFGDGMYKSIDAGKSWKHIGLDLTFAIGTVAIHPKNPDLVYAAAMGNTYAPNPDRGLFRSRDGGQTWKKILFRDDSTGCIDVKLDPTNPNVVYASLWMAYRRPWTLWSGGRHSGLYRSADGGDTWQLISENPGMPVGLKGKIIVSVAASNPDRLYAIVENKNIGVYRSDDGGASWLLVSRQNDLTQRPWYFSQIFADPKNENVVYVLNVEFYRSIDGGVTWKMVPNRHGDNHDMWINPDDPDNWIMGDDGGPQVTFDGGRNFSDIDLPTAQFYHVNLDNQVPYHVYGAQQDNSSVQITSGVSGMTALMTGNTIGLREWYAAAGGEAGYIVPDPTNPDITIGGEYLGQISMYDRRKEQYRVVSPWPELYSGYAAEKMKYRFSWTYPISFSPHDPRKIYVGSNYVLRSIDHGQNWERISPDLTRHDPMTLKESGGPITLDMTGAEVYATVFSFAESPVKPGLLWAGSDDGLVHVSMDDGKNWTDVTPKGMGEFALISYVEPSHFDPATCYVSATRYKMADNHPYLYKTTDYGKTWTSIIGNLPTNTYNRCLREDPVRKGLLYCGTETGIWVSFNDGASWESLQLNLPNTPVVDIQVHPRDHDLVIATHGRSFWILDDITPLYQIRGNLKEAPQVLFKPRDTYRLFSLGTLEAAPAQAGQNRPSGVIVNYYLREQPKGEVRLQFCSASGDSLITYSNLVNLKGEPITKDTAFIPKGKVKRPGFIPADAGMNQFTWNMQLKDAVGDKSAEFEATLAGPCVPPGDYLVKLYVAGVLVQTQPFRILNDPNNPATTDDIRVSYALQQKINAKLNETGKATKSIRDTRDQINAYLAGITDTAVAKGMRAEATPLLAKLDSMERRLYNPLIKSGEDNLRFPVQLEEKLAGLNAAVLSHDDRPTQGMQDVYADLSAKIDKELNSLKELYRNELPRFNQKAGDQKRPAVKLEGY